MERITLIVFLMALMLIGQPVVEFVYVSVVTVVVAATLLCAGLIFMHTMDSVIDYFYTAR